MSDQNVPEQNASEETLFIVTLISTVTDFVMETAPLRESQVKDLMALSRDRKVIDVHLPASDGSVIFLTEDAFKSLIFTYTIFETEEAE